MTTTFKTNTVEELHKKVTELREQLRVFRFGGAGSRTRNVREGRVIRRDVAKVLTELRVREIASEQKKA
jgi:ribosomal protein L29